MIELATVRYPPRNTREKRPNRPESTGIAGHVRTRKLRCLCEETLMDDAKSDAFYGVCKVLVLHEARYDHERWQLYLTDRPDPDDVESTNFRQQRGAKSMRLNYLP